MIYLYLSSEYVECIWHSICLGVEKNWQVNLCLHFMLLLKLSVRSLGEICGPQAKFSFMTDLRLSSEVLWKADLSKNFAFIFQWRILKWAVNEGEARRVQCAFSPVLGTKGSCQLCSLEPYISEIKSTLNTPIETGANLTTPNKTPFHRGQCHRTHRYYFELSLAQINMNYGSYNTELKWTKHFQAVATGHSGVGRVSSDVTGALALKGPSRIHSSKPLWLEVKGNMSSCRNNTFIWPSQHIKAS